MKKRRTPARLASALLSLLFLPSLLLFPLCSCRKAERTKTVYGCFDTFATLTVYARVTDEEFASLCGIFESTLTAYHRAADIYHEYSGEENLASLNRKAGTEEVALSDGLFDLLSFSKEISSLTEGALDPMLGSVLSLWHGLREEGKRLPTSEELNERSAHISLDSLILDGERKTAFISDPEASIDLGAIAKGYAAQKAADALREAGAESTVLNVGGNLVCIGTKPDGKPWTTGIKNPDPDREGEPYVATLPLADASLATTGGYERFYTVDGARYHHVIDPKTLYPANLYDSVSVLSSHSGISDALSTAFFLLPKDRAEAVASAVLSRYSLDEITVVYVENGSSETVTYRK